MSYATKYYFEHVSDGGIPYYGAIKKDGFVGDPSQLYLTKGGCNIEHQLKAWDESLIPLVVKLSLLNDASDFNKYDDLFTLEDKEFQLTINASYGAENITWFDGWINSSPVSQKYLENQTLNLTASNFISRMDELTPPILNSRDASEGDMCSLIDLINDSLRLTGKEDNIWINCHLEPSGGLLTGTNKTLFNRCAADPQLWWDDNENKGSGGDIIEDILTSFNCYLYWWDGNWYIERYRDLFPVDGSKSYVEYQTDSSYNYLGLGTGHTTTDASLILPLETVDASFVFTGSSQTIKNIPGLQYLEIELKENPVLNLTNNDFTNIEGKSQFPTQMYPPLRGWVAAQWDWPVSGTGWNYPGYKTAGILDTSIGWNLEPFYQIKWTPDSSTIGLYSMSPGRSYGGIQNAILRWGIPNYYSSGVYQSSNKHYAALATRFRASVHNEETKLNIKWKFHPVSVGSGGPAAWDYKCYWTLNLADEGNYWLTRVPETDDDEEYWEYHLSGTFDDYVNTEEIMGADLNEDGYATVEITVPLGDVSGWITEGNTNLILTIHGEDAKRSDAEDWNTSWYTFLAAYGDVEITGESGLDKQKNKIIAEINSNVLNSEKSAFVLYDTPDLYLDNGIKTGFRYPTRTNLWKERSGSTYRSLVEWYIHDRFQLYNRNRREIKGTLKYPGYLKPMSYWYDEYDPSVRPYILSSLSYSIGEDLYRCTWLEYDKATEINLGTAQTTRPRTLVDPASDRRSRRSGGSSGATRTSRRGRTTGRRSGGSGAPRSSISRTR